MPDGTMDNLAALFAGRKLQLTPAMAAAAMGGNPDFNTGQPGPAAAPTVAAPPAPAPVAPPAPASPAPNPAPYAQPVAQPAMNRPDASPPDPYGLGVATPPAPSMAAPTPIQSVAAAQPQQDMTPFQRRQADMQARAGAVADKGNQPRWWERVLAAASAGAVMYGTHNADAAAQAGDTITGRRMRGALNPINARLATDQSDIDTSNQEFGQKRQTWEDALKATQAQDQSEYRSNLADAKQQNADTASQLADTKQQLADSKKPTEPKTESEIALALSKAQATGDTAGTKLYKGALDELARQKMATREPKDTTAADVAKALQVAEQRQHAHDRIDNEMERDRDKQYKSVENDITVKYNPAAMKAKKDQIDSGLESKYQPKHADVDNQYNNMLGLTKSGGALKTPAKTSGNPSTTPVQSNPVKAAGASLPAPAANADKAQPVDPGIVRQYAKGKNMTFQQAKSALEATGRYKVGGGQ